MAGKFLLDSRAGLYRFLGSKHFWAFCLALSFGASSFVIFLEAASYIGAMLHGLTPQKLGLFIGKSALGFTVGNYISGRYSIRFGIENMVFGGLFISWIIIFLALLLILIGSGSVTVLLVIMSVSGVVNGITMPSATAKMMSVRPYLAGTASGLGGSFMIAIGGGLSVFSSLIMDGQTTEAAMAMVMCISTALRLVCSFYVR